jgi:hypothetical protein
MCPSLCFALVTLNSVLLPVDEVDLATSTERAQPSNNELILGAGMSHLNGPLILALIKSAIFHPQ